MEKINNVINSEMAPTIRPVLDLSSVQAGAKDLNGIFGQNRSLSVINGIKRIPTVTSTDNYILPAINNLSTKQEDIDISGTLTVQVANDKGEIIGIAETAIKDILRRESR